MDYRNNLFPDLSDTERHRSSGSPGQPYEATNFEAGNPTEMVINKDPGTAGPSIDMHEHLPTVDPAFQPQGPVTRPSAEPEDTDHTQQTSPPTSTPTGTRTVKLPIRLRVRARPLENNVKDVHFNELSAHTAKCDLCDRRNTDEFHVPVDGVRVLMSVTSPTTPTSNADVTNTGSDASPEEAAVSVLLNLKNSPGNACENADGGGQWPGANRRFANSFENGVEPEGDTEILPDDDTEEEANLPENLVNVRRNPSRRARPTDMKE
ncbi:uncharacterized protein N7482_004285 [Penicillium canariense]|uniref:Uncharacterized protein n=1 Tax=Penicillium canariense TaxID=189055 RepID=A0A9W9I8F4_9EURO|nr:uncharacterized protein N7482_004285 [Penicillium canariense]KAJ5168691.1 hypothetical protein N7482_004285 [Penicillium canariense]